MLIAADQWPLLSRLFDDALELDPPERERWLAALESPAAALAPQLKALLECHASVQTSDFLAELRLDGPLPAPVGVPAPVAAGGLVGGYRVEREVGRGGMGVVYRAWRADGLIKRPVALKLLHATRYDEDSRARFARERDILAALEHPHIARLYDAGTTDGGLVYLALEYVEGEPLTDYADRRRLGVASRLALFRQVLEAVRYAHRHLTIHRDLKPSNILVTADGDVRLLDFGIAKLLPPDGTAPDRTEFAATALTPAYAAPEQVVGAAATTATDVYALGVVLYELLTGARPHAAAASRRALEDAILGAEPRPPSAAAAAGAAVARGTTVARLRHALAGDLDTIVLKAIRKAPEDRYATADAFAADIDNHLAGRPVLARADSAWYRAGRFLRRNKLLAGATAAAFVALAAGLAVALWQSQLARRQAALADREARKAKAVQAFLVDLLETNTDAQADPVRARSMTAREILDASAGKLEGRLGGVPEVEEAVLVTLIDMYTALGLDEQAARFKQRRIEILTRLRGRDDPEVADELLSYAESIDTLQGSRAALEPLAGARRILERRPDASPAIRARLYRDTARVELKLAPADALAAAEQAVALYRRELPGDDGLAISLGYLARARLWLGDLVGADAAYADDIAAVRRRVPEDLGELVTALLGRADVLWALGRVPEAEAQLRTALAESTRRNGADHIDTVHVETRLGALLHATGRRPEGRALLEHAAAQLGRGGEFGSANLVGPVKRNLAMARLADGLWREAAAPMADNLALKRQLATGALLAGALDDLAVLDTLTGQFAAADALLDEASTIWAQVAGGKADPARGNRFYLHRGQLRLAQGRAADAAAEFGRITEPRDAQAMPLDADRVAADIGLSAAALALGGTDDALRYARSARERVERAPTRAFWPVLEAEACLAAGRAALRRRDLREAQASLARALALRTAHEDPGSPWIAEAETALAEVALAAGERSAAARHAERAARIVAAHPELGPQFRAPLGALLRSVHAG